VIRAQVNLEQERATVDYDPQVLTVARMVETVQGIVILPGLRRAIGRTTRAHRDKPTG
jgi:copper chaperone CopZ